MRVLVLGAYGLVGQAIVRELLARGDLVAGLARDVERARQLVADVSFVSGDLNLLVRENDWLPLLDGVDAVVNASGALQSGLKDNLALVQRDSIVALVAACERANVRRFVQVSAPGAGGQAETEFLRTKGQADEALRASQLDWVILKPGLVVSQTAYGGTSLLRMLAAFPLVQPIALPDARLQTVDVKDVASAAARALDDSRLARKDFDLVAPAAETLQDIVLMFRGWLGFSKPAVVWHLPDWLAGLVGRLADFAGLLGWRPPLRTTALQVLADNVTGDPEPWRRSTGHTFKSLGETLREMPSTRQERIFARTQLVFPVLVVIYAGFWIASGLVGLWQSENAAMIVSGVIGETGARWSVLGGSVADILVGVGLCFRRSFVAACVAAIAVCVVYLLAGSILTPNLWADPLGPFVKIIPVAALSMALIAMAEER
jgi:uncharacterized protein YbjT (DUF2867 family)